MFDLELMRRLSAPMSLSDVELEAVRSWREPDDDGGVYETVPGPSFAVPNLSDAEVAALVSDEARLFVIGYEVTSRQHYERKLVVPEWPKGDSGVTIGIGYDLGYVSEAEFVATWSGLIPDTDIAHLKSAIGKKRGDAAAIVSSFAGIRVPWDAAEQAYIRSTIPKFGRQVLATYPHAADLKGHCFGALFSLVFNRGAKLTGDRRREMATIRDLMFAEKYDSIPVQFRNMKRLWLGTVFKGLVARREAEAQLFERGLELRRAVVAAAPAAPGTTAPAPVAGAAAPAPGMVAEAVADEGLYDGDGLYYEEETEDTAHAGPTLEATSDWAKVKWPANDDDAPDYHHVLAADRAAFSGKTFDLSARELELLIGANAFDPLRNNGRIVFALRGAELVQSAADSKTVDQQVDRPSLTLRDTRPNHRDFRCVIGVYDLTTERLSGFAASTVPNPKAVSSYVANGQSGNLTPTGCYRLNVGWHLVSKPERKIPGCLVENARTKAVIRSSNNHSYELTDDWFADRPTGNNLHPAKSESSASFSSWGCLVVRGNYVCGPNREKGTHTEQWGAFRKALGLAATGTAEHGREYDVVVLTGLEAAIAGDIVRQGAAAVRSAVDERLARLRQGSRGERVKKLQAKLGAPVTGAFDCTFTKAFADRQKKDLAGKSDGIFSPVLDRQWRLDVFAPEPPVVVAVGQAATVQQEAVEDEQLGPLYYEIGLEHEALRRDRSLVNGAGLESVGDAVLEGIALDLGVSLLKSVGKSVVAGLEQQLQQAVCGDPVGLVVDKQAIRDRIDSAARRGVEEVKTYLAGLLSTMTFLPPSLTRKAVDVLFDRIIAPATAGAGQAVTDKMDLSAQWLCQQWQTRLVSQGASAGTGAPAPTQVPAPRAAAPAADATMVAETTAKTVPGLMTPPPPPPPGVVAPQPAAAPPPPPAAPPTATAAAAGTDEIEKLLSRIELAAKGGDGGSAPDAAAVRSCLGDLYRLTRNGAKLLPAHSERLMTALCETPVLDHFKGTAAFDPYALMVAIESALKCQPVPDKATARRLIGELIAALANASVPLAERRTVEFLKRVKDARLFDELTLLADRLACRNPAMLGPVSNVYAQGLIDSGRIQAAIDLLEATRENPQKTPDERVDAKGILGRAHKQVYVNHARTPREAAILSESIGPRLVKAIDSYASVWEPSQPRDNFYHGVNYIALLKRAGRDGVSVRAKGDVDGMAKAMAAALAPMASANSSDFWMLATTGEAALAAGDLEQAATWYSKAAKIGTAFELGSAARQLEQVWQLEASTSGAGAILMNLKAALASKDNADLVLTPREQRNIAQAVDVEFAQHFETVTEGGKFLNLATLKRIVDRGSSVAMVQLVTGALASTKGTGFLVSGSALSQHLAADKSYILTNAHVVWDQEGGAGGAMSPDRAQIVFETDLLEGRTEAYRGKVVWQSPADDLDATLIELDRPVTGHTPLPIAPAGRKLVVFEEGMRDAATRLAVLGHAGGRNLALSLLGSLEEMKGTLVDLGPRKSRDKPIFLHYTTPTEGGNSGSPVFEVEDWNVVALHHAGYLPAKGGIEKLGNKTGVNVANEGISIWSIKDAIAEAMKPDTPKPRKRWLS